MTDKCEETIWFFAPKLVYFIITVTIIFILIWVLEVLIPYAHMLVPLIMHVRKPFTNEKALFDLQTFFCSY